MEYEIVAELVDAMMKNEVQVFLKNHNKRSLATLIKTGCWFESNLSHFYNFENYKSMNNDI